MDFNFPQHLLPLLLLNTAFFGFLQYIDRLYKDAIKEVEEQTRNSDFDPTDENKSEIFKKIRHRYESLRDSTRINNTDLNKAYVGEYIGAMAVYLFNCLCWFYPDYLKKLEIFWIISLAIGIIVLFVIIFWMWRRAKKMMDQVCYLRYQRKEFLDLLQSYQTDLRRAVEKQKTTSNN